MRTRPCNRITGRAGERDGVSPPDKEILRAVLTSLRHNDPYLTSPSQHPLSSELTPVFRVTQEIEFCYGHRLLNYEGKCRHLHGHNARAIIVLEGEDLDERGMLIDFSDIKRELRTWIDDHLDHRMILCDRDPVVAMLQETGEQLYLIDCNPTAENLARLICDQWETPPSCATYRPELS